MKMEDMKDFWSGCDNGNGYDYRDLDVSVDVDDNEIKDNDKNENHQGFEMMIRMSIKLGWQ